MDSLLSFRQHTGYLPNSSRTTANMSGATTASTYVDTRNYLSYVSPYAEGSGMDHLQETLRKENQQSVRLRASLFASEREYRLLRNLPNASISARWAYASPPRPQPCLFYSRPWRNTLLPQHTSSHFLALLPIFLFRFTGTRGRCG